MNNNYEISLFPFQQEVFDHPARFKIVAAGRRTGKSYLACVMAYHHCLQKPNRRAVLIGPTVSMIRESMWTTLKTIVANQHMSGLPREIDLEIRFVNGSKISLKGFDRPDSLRGISPSPSYIILDEFAFIKQHAFTEVVLPMTSDPIKKAGVLIISTPKGVSNDFYNLFCKGQEPNDLWKSWQFTAANVRPDMKEEIELAKSTLDLLTFQQEYAATFNTSGDSCFYNFNRELHVSDNLLPFNAHEDIHISIDFNVKIMAASVWAHRGDQLHCLNEFYGSADTTQLIRRIKKTYPNRTIICYPDASGNARKSSAATGTTDFSLLRKAGFKIRARSKQPRIVDSVNCVNALLQDAAGNCRMFFAKDKCTRTIASMEQTAWKPGNTTGMDNAIIDKSKNTEHFSDGVRYIAEMLYPISKDKPTVIRDRSWSF